MGVVSLNNFKKKSFSIKFKLAASQTIYFSLPSTTLLPPYSTPSSRQYLSPTQSKNILNFIIKGTISVISIDPSLIYWQGYVTILCQIKYKLNIHALCLETNPLSTFFTSKKMEELSESIQKDKKKTILIPHY